MTQRTHDRRWQLILASVLLVLIGIMAGLVLSSSLDLQKPVRAERSSGSTVPASPFVSVADRVVPAVVFIDTKQTMANPHSNLEGPFGDFFRDFGMPNNGRQQITVPASGSGFIISKDGYIMTNAHVVAHATDIKVRLHDGREFKAKLVGADPTADVAVIRITADGLPTVVEGTSSDIRVGDWVVAVGNPSGLEGTVTVGVVSAKGRQGLAIAGGGPSYQDFIQTDAAINFGNSGGPLCNINGEVIGINSAINAQTQGIGFAIPIELARSRAQQLIAHGKVVRGYLGIRPTELTPAIASGFGLPSGTKGVVVGQVEASTPAAKAGVREGDVLTRFDGKEVQDVQHFRFMVADAPPRKRVRVDVLRDGRPMTFYPVLTEFPEEQVASDQGNDEDDEATPQEGGDTVPSATVRWLGLSVRAATSGDMPAGRAARGVIVTDVDPSSLADDAGLQKEDVIERVNGTAVTSVTQFRSAIQAARAGKKSLVLFLRRGDTTTFVGIPIEG